VNHRSGFDATFLKFFGKKQHSFLLSVFIDSKHLKTFTVPQKPYVVQDSGDFGELLQGKW
jgi:hypothetical protein